MAITVKHKFVSAIPDAGDPTIVQPSNWNDNHDLVGTVPVANGGTGADTLTGYVKGNGTAAMTAASTIPSTDVTGLGTMSTQNSNNISVTGGSMNGVTISDYVATATKGVANGVASLDGSGTVPVSQLPSAVLGALNYQGTWNASTNTPTLTSSVGTKGYYYVVNVAGSTNLNGITDWLVGDWAVFNGSVWQKVDNTDAVTSVNGLTGTVVLTASSVGAVSSVAATVPSFLSVSGSPITSSGTLAISYSGTALPVANGGTGVTASSGANSVVLRDSNQNITANSISEGFSNVAATGTTTVLTVASVPNYVVTGSGGQTYQLPDATTLTSGANYTFNNNQSSGTIVVKNNSSTTVATIQSGGYVDVILLSNATAAGSWDVHNFAPSNVSWSTNTFDYAGSFTSGTWNGNAVAYNRGGTGQSSAFTAGGIVYGSTTSALAVTPIGTTGQVLTSAGAGTPTWTTPTTGTVTSVTGTSPVVSSGGNTPAISMPAATGSVNGYLTSTDWNTFNGKGSGTVTSVAATVPSFLSVTGSPITSSGTLALSYSGTALPILNGGTGVTTSTGSGDNVLSTRPTMSVTGSGFTLQDATDNTKQANFDLSGITTATTRTLTFPNTTGTLAALNLAQTFSAAQTFSGAVTQSASAYAFNSTGANWTAGSQTTGTFTVGGTSGTGTITLGRSTVSQQTDIQAGATASGSTKTINIGTGGVSGSTTTMAIGSANGTTVTANGTWTYSTPLAATNMTQATTSTSGYLSSTDWNTFNGKGSGTVTSVTGTAPVVSSGGATPAISMAAATGSVNGYLTSTDWTTFNAKASPFTYTSGYIPYGQGTTTPNQSSNLTFASSTLTAPIVSASNGLVVNSATVSASYSLPSGSNAMSVGPITVASGQSVTVASGQRWVVL